MRAQDRRTRRALGEHRSAAKNGRRPPTREVDLVTGDVLLRLPFGLYLGRKRRRRVV